jgi:hypothetical protein
MTHQLIASPYPEGHLVVRPGYDGAVRIGAARYAELRDAPPGWLAEAARAGWGLDLAGRPSAATRTARVPAAGSRCRAVPLRIRTDDTSPPSRRARRLGTRGQRNLARVVAR